MKQKAVSYQVAESIDIKQVKNDFKAVLYYNDADELLYQVDKEQLIYIFKYGVVCFLNYDSLKSSAFLKYILMYCKNPLVDILSEEYEIETNAPHLKIGFNKIEIPHTDIQVLRLIMLNVSQSVALDYFSDQTSRLSEETNFHTQMLEKKGKLGISGKNLKKYIGKTLLLKNRIAENLYIFDSPPETWDDEKLDKLDIDLKKIFDLQQRSRNIHEGLSIVRDNLELFRALLQDRNSVVLEWIVILLILIEVLNLFIEKIFH
jgi:uncharacterized Rmd1/YagE family protein